MWMNLILKWKDGQQGSLWERGQRLFKNGELCTSSFQCKICSRNRLWLTLYDGKTQSLLILLVLYSVFSCCVVLSFFLSSFLLSDTWFFHQVMLTLSQTKSFQESRTPFKSRQTVAGKKTGGELRSRFRWWYTQYARLFPFYRLWRFKLQWGYFQDMFQQSQEPFY